MVPVCSETRLALNEARDFLISIRSERREDSPSYVRTSSDHSLAMH